MMKRVYHYDEKSGSYLGHSVAQMLPDSQEVLLPAHATLVAPAAHFKMPVFDKATNSWKENGTEAEAPAPSPAETEEVTTPSIDITLETNADVSLETRVPPAATTKRKRRRGKPRKK